MREGEVEGDGEREGEEGERYSEVIRGKQDHSNCSK